MLRNSEARSYNQCCSGKAVSIAHSKCVFLVSDIQHAVRMRRIILSSVVCPAVPYFFTFSKKRHEFRGKNLLNIQCLFGLSLHILPAAFLILRRTERDVAKNVYWSYVK